MKKFIYFLLFFFASFVANSQVQRPANSPSPNSPTGYSLYGYVRADSGFIWKQRDTFPAKFPTIIWHTNGNFYKSNGNGGAWSLFASSTAGTVSVVSGNSPISVANGTTTPTISVDTSYNGLATKKWLYKVSDSLGYVKLNLSDTLSMLLPYLRKSDTVSMLSGYLRKGDTSAMLSNYVPTFRTINTNAPLFGGGNLTTNRTLGADTGRNAAQLVTGGSLTAVKDSLVALIASSGGGTVLSVSTTDGYGVISSVTDPTSTPNISLRVDTVSVSTRAWRQKGIDSVQSNLTAGLALKLNISDTAAMLSNRLKISDTAFMLMPFMQYSDTSYMLSPYRRTSTKITNSDLVNSTISGVSLGSNLNTLSFGTYLQGGASSYNGATNVTIATNATSTNVGSTLVARDENGDFSARNISATNFLGTASTASTVTITNDVSTNATYYPMFSTVTTGSTSSRVSSSKLTYNPSTGNLSATTFTGNLTGNASSASVLQTPRTINGVAFDGSANITISAAVSNSLSAGYGISGSSYDGSLARTWNVDTALMIPYTDTNFVYGIATKSFVRSLGYGTGSVTSVATNNGSGITGGTITTTGTIAADTSILSTKANVTGLLVGYTTTAANALKLNISDTASMLSNYRRKTTLIENSDLRNSAITINGSSTSLGGSVSVGTVTSVAASAGTGISVSGSPITSSGTLTITNTAPDQTVTLTAGSGISVTGTYPSFTITNSSPSSGGTVTSVSAGTGMSFTTITSSGAVNADTTVLATRAYAAGLDVAKANTSLNNVNGVLSSTYGGAGSVNGILKANGSGVVSAAVAGTDYVVPSALSGYLPLSGGTLTGSLSGTNFAIGARSTSNAFQFPDWRIYNTAGGNLAFNDFTADRVTLSSSTLSLGVALSGTSASFSGNLKTSTYFNVGSVTSPFYSEQLTIGIFDNPKMTLAATGGYRWSTYVDGNAGNGNYHIRYEDGGGIDALNITRSGNTLIKTTTDNGTDALQVAGSVRSSTNIIASGQFNKVFSSAGSTGSPVWEEAYGYGVTGTSYGTLQFSNEYSSNLKTGARIVLHNGTSAYVALSLDASTGAALFSSSVTANSFVKSGGTSSQFLKADGSVDGSTYITSASVGDGTLTLNVSGSGLSGSQSFTANQSSNATFTVTSNATTAATASTIAYRDASANLTAAGFFESSDKRLKDIISRDGDVAYFKWKDGKDTKTHIGYIAQEVQKTNPDQVKEDEKGMLSVNYTEILVQKIRELERKIEKLEKKAKN